MDVKAVDCVDAHGKILESIFLYFAGGGAEDGYIDLSQFADVGYYGIGSEFEGFLTNVAAYYAGNLHVGGFFKGLDCKPADVAVAYYGCADFLIHTY